MSHNKMYRQIEGYENSLDLASDIVDTVDELKHNLRYGKSVTKVLFEVSKIESIIRSIRIEVEEGNGERIDNQD